MLRLLRRSSFAQHSIWAFAGQIAFLLANFLLFLLLINKVSQEVFGNWALYITLISLIDAFRQGMIHNGLSHFIIQQKGDRSIVSTGTCLNYAIILLIGLITMFLSWTLNLPEGLSTLLPHAWKSLLVLGTLQFIGTLTQSRQQFKVYCIVNVLYLISFVTLLFFFGQEGSISLVRVINIQLIALIPALLYFLVVKGIKWHSPKMSALKSLLSFGKYAAGTNLVSILFHRADILMIAFFLDPAAVALFHFASKIMNYAELPMHALSQVIYPRLSANHRTGEPNRLKEEYALSIIRLLVFVIPICWLLMTFPGSIISLLSSQDYDSAYSLVIVLSIGMVFKPFGRVFGLTLDAIGRPDVNFRILCQSLAINCCMNLMLIPKFGLMGAAIATSSSIAITVITGQMIISKYTCIKLGKDLKQTLSNQLGTLKTSTWN